MALICCHECNARISNQAVACPHCGAPAEVEPSHSTLPTEELPYRPNTFKAVVLIAAAIVVLVAIMRVTGTPVSSETPSPEELTPEEVAVQQERAAVLAARRQQQVEEKKRADAERAARAKEEKERRDEKYREQVWIVVSQDAVRKKLRDPSSAKFSDVYFHRGKDGVPTTCGKVNSKNAYGGYAGFQRFVSAGSAGMTFLEEEVKDFHVLWNKLCRD